MEDDIDALERCVQSGPGGQVAQYALGSLWWQMPSRASARTDRPQQATDMGAFRQQTVDQMAADETGRACDQNGDAAEAGDIHGKDTGPILLRVAGQFEIGVVL